MFCVYGIRCLQFPSLIAVQFLRLFILLHSLLLANCSAVLKNIVLFVYTFYFLGFFAVLGKLFDAVFCLLFDAVLGKLFDAVFCLLFDAVLGKLFDAVLGKLFDAVLGKMFDSILGELFNAALA